MEFIARGTRLGPNGGGASVLAGRARPRGAAHAHGSALLLQRWALGELFAAKITAGKHPPSQLQSIPMDAAGIPSAGDQGAISTPVVHGSKWGMEEQHDGPRSFRTHP